MRRELNVRGTEEKENTDAGIARASNNWQQIKWKEGRERGGTTGEPLLSANASFISPFLQPVVLSNLALVHETICSSGLPSE
jgi:hypothetical protein